MLPTVLYTQHSNVNNAEALCMKLNVLVVPAASESPVPSKYTEYGVLRLSSISPTGCSTAVTGVVPAESWKSVVRSLGSYQAP